MPENIDGLDLVTAVSVMDVGHKPTASSRNFLQENQKETYTDFFKYA